MAPWPVNLPTNFELHLDQRPTPSPLIKCPVDTKTVGKEGRTPRGLSVSFDHLPRSGCHQLCCNRLMAEEGSQVCAVGGSALGDGPVFAWRMLSK